jgi:hypothetical protein
MTNIFVLAVEMVKLYFVTDFYSVRSPTIARRQETI